MKTKAAVLWGQNEKWQVEQIDLDPPGEGEVLPRPGSLDYWIWFPGVGFGDVKLLAMIGAVLGPFGVLETILVASVAGLVFGLAWAAFTRRLDAPFGFAPAIACGALFVVLLSPRWV